MLRSEPACRVLASLAVTGTESTLWGRLIFAPTSDVIACATVSCRVLAGSAIAGTVSTYPGLNARARRCVTDPLLPRAGGLSRNWYGLSWSARDA